MNNLVIKETNLIKDNLKELISELAKSINQNKKGEKVGNIRDIEIGDITCDEESEFRRQINVQNIDFGFTCDIERKDGGSSRKVMNYAIFQEIKLVFDKENDEYLGSNKDELILIDTTAY